MSIALKVFCIAPTETGSPVGGRHAGSGYIDHIHSFFELSGISHILAEDHHKAGLILVLEPSIIQNYRHYAAELVNHPVIQEYPERCYTYNGCDRPWPILPGMYVSLDKDASDPLLHCGGPHVDYPNAHVQDMAVSTKETTYSKGRLACFRGSKNSAVRNKLFNLAEAGKFSDAVNISPSIGSYFANGEEGQKKYVEEILDHAFSMAPSGNGPSSFRIYEIMSLGRAPVIIADSWMKPRNIPWAECSLTVAESDVLNIESILEKKVHLADQLGSKAKSVYQENFAPDAILKYILYSLEQLQRENPYSDDPSWIRERITLTALQAPSPPLINRVIRKMRKFRAQIRSISKPLVKK